MHPVKLGTRQNTAGGATPRPLLQRFDRGCRICWESEWKRVFSRVSDSTESCGTSSQVRRRRSWSRSKSGRERSHGMVTNASECRGRILATGQDFIPSRKGNDSDNPVIEQTEIIAVSTFIVIAQKAPETASRSTDTLRG